MTQRLSSPRAAGSGTGGTRRGRAPRRFAQAATLATALLLVFNILVVCRDGTHGQSAARDVGRHVLVISVDGMGSSFYMTPSASLRIPNLRRLMQQGSYAEGVEGVYPTVTYPSHTTIVTGRVPGEHGIYTNLSSREPGKNPRDWFWFANAIKVPTLWDEAHKANLTTAAVSWPVSVGASIDWNIPEIWDPAKGEVADMMYLAKFMNPVVGAELLGALGSPQPGADADNDTRKTRIAAYLIKSHRPGLTLVHLANLDEEEHAHGPASGEAAATLESTDAHIGEILAAVKEAGLENSTAVFVVSDHGFLPIRREIRPNVLLAKAGLLTAGENGFVTGGRIATVANGGSFFIYWLTPQTEAHNRAQDLRPVIDAALGPLREQGLVWGVLDRSALKDLGAEPAVEMALEAPDGVFFSGNAGGQLVNERTPGGTHGFLPFRKGLESSFIAWGPGIKGGVNLHRIRMTAIGPTILRAMGINDAQFGDEPPLGEIFKTESGN